MIEYNWMSIYVKYIYTVSTQYLNFIQNKIWLLFLQDILVFHYPPPLSQPHFFNPYLPITKPYRLHCIAMQPLFLLDLCNATFSVGMCESGANFSQFMWRKVRGFHCRKQTASQLQWNIYHRCGFWWLELEMTQRASQKGCKINHSCEKELRQ